MFTKLLNKWELEDYARCISKLAQIIIKFTSENSVHVTCMRDGQLHKQEP